MQRLSFFLFLALPLAIALCQGPPPPPPQPLGPPPVPPGNPITAAKVDLGKTLYWDEQLSSTRTVACATCHIVDAGGGDPRVVRGSFMSTNPGPDTIYGSPDDIAASPGVPMSNAAGTYEHEPTFGIGVQVTARKSPTVLNTAYAPRLFWDGRAGPVFRDPLTGAIVLGGGAALESQVLGPPLSTGEMAHTGRDWLDVAQRVSQSTPLALSPQVPAALDTWINCRDYGALFQEAFGSAGVTPARIAMAIATYERTLVTDQTPFNAELGGTPSLTAQEQRGRGVFVQSDCVRCHGGNRLTDDQFHYIGVRPTGEDTGRFAETGNPADMGAFKTPSLR